ncbi:MAG: glycogen debranching protein GlgX, partial [Pseudomonadota bacterium]
MTLVSTDSNVAVFSRGATAVDLCLFDDAGRETRRIRLPARSGPVWHGRVSGLREGQRYGLRVTGPEATGPADCFDPAKLLIDPYARHLTGGLIETAALSHKGADTADAMPLGVVTASLPPADRPARPLHPWPETVIYEAHLRGLTMAMPGIPESIAGTWEALAHPDLIAHLQGLGVTALELLPVQAIRHHGFLRERGLSNYWGYGSLAFFAPEPQYLGPAGEAGIHAAIDALHAAGIEVLLDVVFNHTGEGDAEAPALSFRGIDNASYYLHDPSAPGRYIDHTGCGNSLDLTEPFVLRLVLDALRHWAGHYNVDGFRFDLMTTLARGPGGYDRAGGFLSALRQDPLLADRKLIAEPWDLGPGGYQLGNFPAGIAEWNDRYRDDVRRFWRGDAHAAPALATRLMGSAEVFDHETRPPWSSVNFVTAHDGFTLADLTAYGAKRNEANGEENRDGRDENFSDPIGGEGPDDTVDDAARARRNLRRRNLLATLLLSQGTPMLLAGDELANSQGGNNNAYAQDNETGWLSW